MIDFVFSLIGTILYPLFSIIFLFIDGIQYIFYAFAGIGGSYHFDGQLVTSGNSGADNDNGLVFYLMRTHLVQNMLMSIMLLGLFLIIIFTVMAFIKNAYAAKQKGWKEIIGNAFKGLANFIFIPVCCLLGVWLGNILLQAINGATSSGGSPTMARKLFIACAYNANIVRNANITMTTDLVNGLVDLIGEKDDYSKEEVAYAYVHVIFGNWIKDAGITVEPGKDLDYYADKIDELYSTDRIFLGSHINVGLGYNLWQINYLILIVGGIFMLYVLCALSFAMVRRMFLILMLFIVSPGICAMFPIDEGGAVKKWKDEFIKQVLSAYGAVAGLNIFFSLLPLVEQIQLYGAGLPGTAGFMDDIVHIFIIVSGLLIVKEFISMISGFVGGEDAYARGGALMKSASKEVLGRMGKATRATVGAFSKARAAQKAGGSFWESLGKSAGGGLVGLGNKMLSTASGGVLDIADHIKVGKQAAKEGKIKTAQNQRGNELALAVSTATNNYNTALNEEETAREEYDKAKQSGNFSQKMQAAKKYKAAQRNRAAAYQDLQELYDVAEYDLQGWSEKQIAKKLGISPEALKRNRGAYAAIDTKSAQYENAQTEANAMVEAMRIYQQGTPQQKQSALDTMKKSGLDLSALSAKLGKSIEQLINLFKSGVEIKTTNRDSVEKQTAAAEFNRALEKQKKKEEKASSLGESYLEHLLAQNGVFIDSKGQKIRFDDSQIAELKSAFASKDVDAIDNSDIVRTLREEGKKQQQKVNSELATLEQIKKAIKDLTDKK